MVQLEFEGPGSSSTVDNKDGTYTCKYTLVHGGEYSLRVSVNKEEVPNSPFRVMCHHSKACGSKSVIVDGGVRESVAGEEAVFVVEARDEFGNRVVTGGSVVSVDTRGAGQCSVHDGGNGEYTCTLLLSVSGRHQV